MAYDRAAEPAGQALMFALRALCFLAFSHRAAYDTLPFCFNHQAATNQLIGQAVICFAPKPARRACMRVRSLLHGVRRSRKRNGSQLTHCQFHRCEWAHLWHSSRCRDMTRPTMPCLVCVSVTDSIVCEECYSGWKIVDPKPFCQLEQKTLVPRKVLKSGEIWANGRAVSRKVAQIFTR